MMINIFKKIITPRILLYLLPVLLFSESLFTGKVLFWGIPSLQFIPWRVLAFKSILDNDLPLWNSLNGMGAPLLANYQLAIFYPPSWLLLLLYKLTDITGLTWGHTLLAVLHIIWAGIGMSIFVKKVGVDNEIGQVISGLTFSMGGYFIARTGFFSILWAGAWLPWILLYSRNIYPLSGNKINISIPLIISISFQLLAGHAQLTWYTFLLAIAWVIFTSFSKFRYKGIVLSIGILLFSYSIAACLSAIQLIPTLELFLNSQRSTAVDYATASSYSYWPWRIITLISPNFFGNPGIGNYWGYANFWEDNIYLGFVPFALALTTIKYLCNKTILPERDYFTKSLHFFWGLILVGFFLALGRNTPIFPFLFQYVPTFNMFNAPSRYLIWVAFGLSTLAGIGVKDWKKPAGKNLFWFRLGTAGFIGLSIGAVITNFVINDVELSFISGILITALIGFAAGIITLLIHDKEYLMDNKYLIWAALILVSLDLLLAGSKLNPLISPSFYSKNIISNNILSAKIGKHRIYINSLDENRLKFKRFLKFNTYLLGEDWINMRLALLPNLNIIEGINSVNNFDPLLTNRYAEWMSKVGTINSEHITPWLQLMDVKMLEIVNPRNVDIVRYKPIQGGQPYRWYSCTISAENESDALSKTEQTIESGKPFSILVVEGITKNNNNNCVDEYPEFTQLNQTDSQLELKLNSKTDGWLFYSKTWYPGWKIYIDGIQGMIVHGNYAFIAAEIPAGEHNIILTYRPQSLFIGFFITIITATGILIMLLNRRKSHN